MNNLKNTLHKSKLKEFKGWLIKKGYSPTENNANSEVLRWKVKGQVMPIIFNGKSPVHYSCNQASIDFVNEFIQDSKNASGDKVLMPKELTAENGAKLLLSGQFFIEKWIPCKECEGQDYMCEDEVCAECDNEGGGVEKIPVDWDLMRDIYKMAVDNLSI